MVKKDNNNEECWEIRGPFSKDRAEYNKQLYKVLGYEVLLVPATLEELKQECTECFKFATCQQFILKTRRKKGAKLISMKNYRS